MHHPHIGDAMFFQRGDEPALAGNIDRGIGHAAHVGKTLVLPRQQKLGNLPRGRFVITVDAGGHATLFAAVKQHYRDPGGKALLG